jgi:hypothetical protein
MGVKKVKLTTDNSIDFYSAEMWGQEFNLLKNVVDDGTTHVTIKTPRGWKCERKNCKTDYKHTHGTYPTFPSPNP